MYNISEKTLERLRAEYPTGTRGSLSTWTTHIIRRSKQAKKVPS